MNSSSIVRKPTAPQPTSVAQEARTTRAPRPDCAIWHDIARVLGNGSDRSK